MIRRHVALAFLALAGPIRRAIVSRTWLTSVSLPAQFAQRDCNAPDADFAEGFWLLVENVGDTGAGHGWKFPAVKGFADPSVGMCKIFVLRGRERRAWSY